MTLVMGILNVTPDSFSDGGLNAETGRAIAHGLQLAAEGADILDVGGESTRPGSDGVPEAEELRRVIPVIEALQRGVPVIASDLPAKWMWRMNHDFIEAKMFLCTQIMDEARHAEVFRKRALSNGGGLLVSRSGSTSLLRTIIEAKTYTQATALMHLLGEGFVLDIFRQNSLRQSDPQQARATTARE